MRPARSALLGFFLVVAALLACKKNRPLILSTPSNQPVPPSDGGDAGATGSHKKINEDTYSVECFGTNIDCVKEASVVCQKGYDVLASSEGTAPATPAPPPATPAPPPAAPDAGTPDAAAPAADASAPVPATGDAAVPPALPRIEMVVKCKK